MHLFELNDVSVRKWKPWCRSAIGMAAILVACVAPPSWAEPIPRPAPPRPMSLDPAWQAQTEALDATQRSHWRGVFVDERFALGTYQVTEVSRSATDRSGLSLGPFVSNKGSSRLRYVFEGQERWTAECQLDSRKQGHERRSDWESELRCDCKSTSRNVRLKLRDDWQPVTGEITIDGRSLQLAQQAVRGFEVNLRTPAPAYLIRSDEEVLLAAVETLHPGRSWLHRDLLNEDREPIACMAAGLMLVHGN